MLIDITGTILIPGGDKGENCPGNGRNPEIECCCDACDYMLCCFEENDHDFCAMCSDKNCPHRDGKG